MEKLNSQFKEIVDSNLLAELDILISKLKTTEPIFSLIDNENGSLFSIFIPFVKGLPVNIDNKTIFLSEYADNINDQQLIKFISASTELENTLALLTKETREPNQSERQILLENLLTFSAIARDKNFILRK